MLVSGESSAPASDESPWGLRWEHDHTHDFDLLLERVGHGTISMSTVVTRMDSNEAIFKQILDDPDFRDVLAEFYVRKIYERLRHEEA